MKNICDHWDLKDFPYIDLQPNDSVGEKNRAWQGCPSIAVTKKGRVFAGWYSGGVFEPCMLNYSVLVVSDDEGTTWSDPILTVGTDTQNRLRKIDIELWVTEENHLWVMWTNSPYYETSKPASLKEALAGIMPDYHREFPYTEVMVCREPDAEQLVWEKPRILCDGFARNKPIETANGRIVVPAYAYDGDGYTLRISDSGGESFFTSIARGKPDEREFDEISVYEKKAGVLRFLARTRSDGYWESTSYDNGDTWCEASKYENAPSTRCYIGKLKNGMVAYVRNVSDTRRVGMKICLSPNGGETFPWQMILDEREQVSYPELAEDEHGNIYVIYDRERDNRHHLNRETWISGAAKEIVVCKFTVADVIRGTLSDGSYVQRTVSKGGEHRVLS